MSAVFSAEVSGDIPRIGPPPPTAPAPGTPQLYLDMDGVLADFDKTANAILGMDLYKFEWQYGTDEFWARLNRDPGLFESFSPMPDFNLLWGVTKHLNPIVLTAIPKSNPEEVARQKRAWVSRHMGRVRVITCRRVEKANFCKPGDVLVDDRHLAGEAWRAAGGVFIHHRSAAQTLVELAHHGLLGAGRA